MLNKRRVAWLLSACLLMPHMTFANAKGTVNATVLNVRASATTASAILKKVYAKESIQITDITGADPWYQVNVNGTKGYVKREYLTLTKATGTVTATNLNIRSYPSLQKSQVIGSLRHGTQVDILYKVNGFYKIMLNGSAGFVSSDYIKCQYDAYLPSYPLSGVGTILVWTGGNGSSSTTSASKGDKVVETAMKYLGNPYVYGGTSLTNGTDCSGFTQSIMKLHGVTIPRTSSLQSKHGQSISRANLQKGDLLFFGTSVGSISHCGIYIGNDKMIHASTPATGIIISGAYKSGNLPLQVIRRVL